MSPFWSNKNKLLIFCLVFILIVAILTWQIDIKSERYRPGVNPEQDRVVNQALLVYREAKDSGMDLSSGPCLTNYLLEGWVLDLVHNPRQSVDDLATNQCHAFLEGRSKHLVELDLNGNVMRVK